jgi:hypothetical protein
MLSEAARWFLKTADLEEAVAKRLDRAPNPSDEEFHDWAEGRGENVHQAEAAAYRLASAQAKFQEDGKANKEGLKPADVPPAKLEEGAKIEAEHTPDKPTQRRIAADHIAELGEGYYPALKQLEERLKKEAAGHRVVEKVAYGVQEPDFEADRFLDGGIDDRYIWPARGLPDKEALKRLTLAFSANAQKLGMRLRFSPWQGSENPDTGKREEYDAKAAIREIDKWDSAGSIYDARLPLYYVLEYGKAQNQLADLEHPLSTAHKEVDQWHKMRRQQKAAAQQGFLDGYKTAAVDAEYSATAKPDRERLRQPGHDADIGAAEAVDPEGRIEADYARPGDAPRGGEASANTQATRMRELPWIKTRAQELDAANNNLPAALGNMLKSPQEEKDSLPFQTNMTPGSGIERSRRVVGSGVEA